MPSSQAWRVYTFGPRCNTNTRSNLSEVQAKMRNGLGVHAHNAFRGGEQSAEQREECLPGGGRIAWWRPRSSSWRRRLAQHPTVSNIRTSKQVRKRPDRSSVQPRGQETQRLFSPSTSQGLITDSLSKHLNCHRHSGADLEDLVFDALVDVADLPKRHGVVRSRGPLAGLAPTEVTQTLLLRLFRIGSKTDESSRTRALKPKQGSPRRRGRCV